ncbi:MAG: NUDIX domain-containing protein [Alicyclobacillus sp.]|nr:NUDIX domain-containing protein [Alicyclobacillus sp.]
MQIIVNCCALVAGALAMLQKPRRGWWVLPGGKVEPWETWSAAAARELYEEAGLHVHRLRLCGVHLLRTAGAPAADRLIAQFAALDAAGELRTECKEGTLAWVPVSQVPQLAMDEGDRLMLQHTLSLWDCADPVVFFGKFTYDMDGRLLDWSVERSGPAGMPLVLGGGGEAR